MQKTSLDNINIPIMDLNMLQSKYESLILEEGKAQVWKDILDYLNSDEYINKGLFSIDNLGYLYEVALALENKNNKKSNGQYYTPSDVSDLMSECLEKLNGSVVCDVACGTGNLILSYLKRLGEAKAKDLVSSGKVYLYDKDELALKVASSILTKIYGKGTNVCLCDFLDSHVHLPDDCKVISNPPYAKIESLNLSWGVSQVISESRELYSAFMEKIIRQSESSVIITPSSFMGGNKYCSLRFFMGKHQGKIYSFDNIPGHIFNGVKLGTFNSNKVNSVRAAITVSYKRPGWYSYQCTPLIRFKESERKELLKESTLDKFLSGEQRITEKRTKFAKCNRTQLCCLNMWEVDSKRRISDMIDEHGAYSIYVPTTCRYATVASVYPLSRKGVVKLTFGNKKDRDLAYCLFNSSFAYLWWRSFDGGITFPIGLMMSMPTHPIDEEYEKKVEENAEFLIKNEHKFLHIKKNKGNQENIKFPFMYIKKNTDLFTSFMGVNVHDELIRLHSNTALTINLN